MAHENTAYALKMLHDHLKEKSTGLIRTCLPPSTLLRTLNSYYEAPDNNKLRSVCEAFNKCWFTPNCPEVLPLMIGYKLLKTAGLLDDKYGIDYFSIIINFQHPDYIAETLIILHEAELLHDNLVQENLTAILAHNDPLSTVKALIRLHHANLLSGNKAKTYFDVIIQHHRSPSYIIDIFLILDRAGLLKNNNTAQKNINAIILIAQENKEDAFLYALSCLESFKLINNENAQENFNVITVHPAPVLIGNILQFLLSFNSLPQDVIQNYFEIITTHNTPLALHKALRKLKKTEIFKNNGIVAQLCFKTVATHINPDNLADALIFLSENTLLNKCIATNDYFNSIIKNQSPLELARVFVILHKNKKLSPHIMNMYFDLMAQHQNTSNIIEAFELLNNGGLLCETFVQEHFKEIINHQSSCECSIALYDLYKNKLLNGRAVRTYLNAVIQHRSPSQVTHSILMLHQAELLTNYIGTDYLGTVVQHLNPIEAAKALVVLCKAKLLSGNVSRFNYLDILAIIRHEKPYDAACALSLLHEGNLLDGRFGQTYFETILNHEDPYQFALVLSELNAVGLLSDDFNQENLDAIMKVQNLYELSEILSLLCKVNLLKEENAQKNFNMLIAHQDLPDLLVALTSLYNSNLLQDNLAQDHFNSLIKHSEILFGDETTRQAFEQMNIGRYLFAHHFKSIIEICNAHQNNIEAGRKAFIKFVNGTQNTHTASVHDSADLTAWLLYKKYEQTHHRIIPNCFESLLNSLKQFKEQTQKTQAFTEILFKSDTAIRCIERLQKNTQEIQISKDKKTVCLTLAKYLDENNIYIHKLKTETPLTNITLPLNMFIYWLYLETKDQPGFLEAWIDALYEIQRGNNLDEQGKEHDESQIDQPICFSGTVNKFCERLQGLSSLIVLIYINKEIFEKKFIMTVAQHMIEYCEFLLNEAEHGNKSAQELLVEYLRKLEDQNDAGECFERLLEDEQKQIAIFQKLKEHCPEHDEETLKRLFDSCRENILPYLPEIKSLNRYGQKTVLAFQSLVEKSKTVLESSVVPSLPSQKGFFAANPIQQAKSYEERSAFAIDEAVA